MVERKTLNLVVRGSIPRGGVFYPHSSASCRLSWFGISSCIAVAALAQLGERQTEDLKVPGSIPGGGTIL